MQKICIYRYMLPVKLQYVALKRKLKDNIDIIEHIKSCCFAMIQCNFQLYIFIYHKDYSL